MAGLGHLYLIGDACSPKRNLTWATHWLDGAAAQGQPDALAMLGFLAESRVLSRLYNFTGHEPGAAIGAQAGTSASADATLGRSLYEKSVTSGGSLLASMALGSQYANGFGGVAASCPAAAAHYESAAMAAIASLDKKRQLNVEQGWLESQAEVKTLLHPGKVEHEGVDAASVEYMDYCAHVGDVAGQVRTIVRCWLCVHRGDPNMSVMLHLASRSVSLPSAFSRQVAVLIPSTRRPFIMLAPAGWNGPFIPLGQSWGASRRARGRALVPQGSRAWRPDGPRQLGTDASSSR